MKRRKISKEKMALVKESGITFYTGEDGAVYYNLPFWFKETDKEDVYEVVFSEELPDEIRKNTKKEFKAIEVDDE